MSGPPGSGANPEAGRVRHPARIYEAVVIGSSSGGVEALRTILAALDPAFSLPILVVQHTGGESAAGLCEVLAAVSPLPVVEAEHRQPIIGGCVFVAPPGYHLLVEPGPRLALNVDEKVCHVRPSADVLFETAADVWRARLIGVVLTGANDDGARGLAAVRSRRGLAIVQEPEDAVMPEMPAAALRIAGADHVVRLLQVAPLLSELCRPARRKRERRGNGTSTAEDPGGG